MTMTMTTTNPAMLVESRQHELERAAIRTKRIEFCRSASKDIAKKCLLYAVMVAYTFLGGFAFVALERTNEKTLCLDSQNLYEKMESRAVQSFWEMSRGFLNAEDEGEGQMDRINEQIGEFRDNVLALNYDGKDCSLLGMPNGTNYKWNLAASLLFSVTIFTTVGYGNITPQTNWGRLVCIAYAMCGIPLMFVCLASIGEILGDVFRFVYVNICCLGFCKRRRRRRRQIRRGRIPSAKGRPAITIDPPKPNASTAAAGRDAWKDRLIEDDDDDDDVDSDDDVSIPITVTLLVIAGYIGLGVILFANWEGWDVLSAAYYCFITITTIGFGDVVPGFDFDKSGAELKMIVAALYLLFGMSLMSMGFDLIQYEMRNRVPERSAGDGDQPDGTTKAPATAGQPNVQPNFQPNVQPNVQPKFAWSDPGQRAIGDAVPKGPELGLMSPPQSLANTGIKKRGPRPSQPTN